MLSDRARQVGSGWKSEKHLVFTCLVLFEIFATYQISKEFLIVQPEERWSKFADLNLPAGILLLLGAIIATFAISILEKKIKTSHFLLILIATCYFFTTSYTIFIKNDWKGLDVPYDSVGLAREAIQQGILPFIAKYNDRGNPGAPNSSIYAARVHSTISQFQLEWLSNQKWPGNQPVYFGRPFMHPPLFFLTLAGWMAIFGTTDFSATFFMWSSVALWAALIYILLRELKIQSAGVLTLFFISLPGLVLDTWFPNNDVLSGIFLTAGIWGFIRTIETPRLSTSLISGFFFGLSLMTRLTSGILILSVGIIYSILWIQKAAPAKSLLVWLAGCLIVPTTFILMGYHPILTLITAKFRQDSFYLTTQMTGLMKIASFTFLGFPLICLAGFSIFKVSPLNRPGILILIPILATVATGFITDFSFDFHRNMLGTNAAFVLVLGFLNHFPKDKWYQSILILLNFTFTILVTVL